MYNPETMEGAMNNVQSRDNGRSNPLSLDCTLFIASSIVSGLYIIHCSFHCLWIVHYSLLLPFSLDCTLFIAPSIFSGLYIIHMYNPETMEGAMNNVQSRENGRSNE
jgi:hypothetical protein